MPTNRTLTAAAVAAAGLMIAGGAAAASAATSGDTTSATGYGYGAPAAGGYGAPGAVGSSGGDGRHAPHQHTAASAAETTKVKEAVTAKDSAITVTTVQKDPDGSFDALGTKAGQQVRVEVSADYATVTVDSGGGRGGRGDHGGSQDTAVTGAEATKVKDAVTAKDSSVTITEVRKDPDGSYDALGTKAGQQVFFDVSKDLKTITQRDQGAGRRGGDQGQQGQQPGQQAPSGAATSGAAS
ncbi:hypothetical protein [Arsenicicoccus sp. oral taxon 190]|uniref:hypothetical protein n=1 Tax=Arsenicicoccus sp. oral taxon 190 TaxID=1658671 RepID=UPI00067D99F3|nr:hypothetical protein [Arsenicicoccus sp. oral taxon 190]